MTAQYARKIQPIGLILILDGNLSVQSAHQVDDHQGMQLGKGYLQIKIFKHHHKARIVLLLYGKGLLHHIAGLVGKAFSVAFLLGR